MFIENKMGMLVTILPCIVYIAWAWKHIIYYVDEKHKLTNQLASYFGDK